MDGWIKLHRSFLHHGHLAMPPTVLKVFLYLLLRANPIPRRGLAAGQLETTYTEIADDCSEEGGRRLSRTSIAQALKYLEERDMIRREPNRRTKHLCITIVNWHRYQHDKHESVSSASSTSSVTSPEIGPVGEPESEHQKAATDTAKRPPERPAGDDSSVTGSRTGIATSMVTGSTTSPITSPIIGPFESGNPPPERAASPNKNLRIKDNESNEEEVARAANARLGRLHHTFLEITGKFPSGTDDALMLAAIADARAVTADPEGLVVAAMQRAMVEYKPTHLDPRPRNFRYFVGWVRNEIRAQGGENPNGRTRASPDRRPARRRKEPEGAAGAAGSEWVLPEHRPTPDD